MKTNGISKQDITGEQSPYPVTLLQEQAAVRLNLIIRDQDVYEFLGQKPEEDRELEACRAMKTGVLALGYAGAISGVDYVGLRFDALAHDMDDAVRGARDKLTEEIGAKMDPAKPGSYTHHLSEVGRKTEEHVRTTVETATRRIDEKMNELDKSVRAKLDPRQADSYLGQLKAHVDGIKQEFTNLLDPSREGSLASRLRNDLDGYFGENGRIDAVLEDALSLDDPASPLARLKQGLDKQLEEVRTQIQAQEAARAVRQKTTLKGGDFEARLVGMLKTILAPGDTLDDVRNRPGKVDRNKMGDYTIDIANDPGQRIVIESKDETGLSSKSICTTLDLAIKNRAAQIGIFIVAEADQLPGDCICWQVYGGDKIVCAFGEDGMCLNIAVRFARGVLAMRRAEADGIDVSRIRRQLDKARLAMQKLDTARTQADQIRKSSEKIGQMITEVQTSVTETLSDIEASLEESDPA